MSSALLLHAIESFATFLRVERNLSPRTRNAYIYDLRRFHDWLAESLGREKLPLNSVSPDQIRNYIGYLREQLAYKPTTMNRVVSAVRVFFAFCVEEGLLETSPAQDLQRPKLAKKLPVYLVEDELQRLFDAPDRGTVSGRRDYAILVSFASTGIRLQELVGLNTTDLDFPRQTIRVFGKGSKERMIPLNDRATAALLEMMNDPERIAAPGEKAVFLNARGRRLTGRAVQYLLDKYIKICGITRRGVSPHKLRHTFATLLYTRDTELVDIQSLMGHASLTSTQIYTHTNATRLQSAVDRLEFED